MVTTSTLTPSSIRKATAKVTRPDSSLKTVAATPIPTLKSIAPAAATRPSPKRAPPPLPKSSIVTSNSAKTTPLAAATTPIPAVNVPVSKPAANKVRTTNLNVTKLDSNTIKTSAARSITVKAKEVAANKPPCLSENPKSAKALAPVLINSLTLVTKRRIQDPPAGAFAPIQKKSKGKVPNQANSDVWAEELSKELKRLWAKAVASNNNKKQKANDLDVGTTSTPTQKARPRMQPAPV
ncbi:hypothetical protein RSOLAG1IB_11538 [Rhizoctonia solani AG-1 IB]|uniref:Uncharacterized protein n=1 Tax=Thanatephorus cucumeris (strain AG1-IB / isolate 7/3/14) TaxID=1108050 RepID=M5C147_THACB|nr:hypothetical protein BN14_07798 [Rhizoctonia solani AG-1 IB]CEL54006.1 hypothetical protein RSOLAG1IB_11538 [Rhizoctonia solani AG-1 IB]